ncbi:lipopolysaccharide assembly protein LapA domain-containing protein [Pseudomonas sp. MDT2-39-1]
MAVRKLKRLVLLLVALLVALTTVVFVLENQQSVIITLFGWSSSPVSASLCLVVALLVGMIIGPLLTVVLRTRRKVNITQDI